MRPVLILTEAGQSLADRAWVATQWSERMRGWMGKPTAEPGEGLLLDPASSIHTFGMGFSLDLAYLDGKGRVLKLRPQMKPRRVSFGPFLAWLDGQGLQALELPAGTLEALGIKVGQQLQIIDRVEGIAHA